MAKVVNNSTICKATIFVGLNDKESKLQEISTLDAAKFIQREIVKEFEGGTISEATGIYRHQDGTGRVLWWRILSKWKFFSLGHPKKKPVGPLSRSSIG